MAAVMVPGRVVDHQQGDLAGTAADLVRKLNLESPDGTVNGLDLIKADALSLTKWIAGLIGAGGALSGAFSAVVAWNVSPGHEPLKIALVATAGLLLAVASLVVGWVVVTDVRARADTQKARYQARALVVHDYLDLVQKADLPGAPAEVEVRLDGR